MIGSTLLSQPLFLISVMITLVMELHNPLPPERSMHGNQKSCALAGRLARALRQVSVNDRGGLKVGLSPFKIQ